MIPNMFLTNPIQRPTIPYLGMTNTFNGPSVSNQGENTNPNPGNFQGFSNPTQQALNNPNQGLQNLGGPVQSICHPNNYPRQLSPNQFVGQLKPNPALPNTTQFQGLLNQTRYQGPPNQVKNPDQLNYPSNHVHYQSGHQSLANSQVQLKRPAQPYLQRPVAGLPQGVGYHPIHFQPRASQPVNLGESSNVEPTEVLEKHVLDMPRTQGKF